MIHRPPLLTWFTAFLLTAAIGFADEIKIPNARFNPRRARDGQPFGGDGWRVEGDVRWTRRGDRPDGGADFAVTLAPGASISRAIERPEADPTRPGTWCGLFAIDAARAGSGEAQLMCSLTPPAKAAAIDRKVKVADTTFSRLIEIYLSAEQLRPGTWQLVLSASGLSPIHLDDLSFLELPSNLEAMRFAKPNGQLGPDRLESGALGFSAWTAHEHAPLPVVAVGPDSPAAVAGLQPGDLIVAVDGRALPISSCAPGWAWFREGHEAVLGRAVEAALSKASLEDASVNASAGSVPSVRLGLWRAGQRLDLDVVPLRRLALPETFPFDDDVTPRLYDDLITWVRKNRRPQGQWAQGGTDWIQTSFAGLALLGRRDPQDREVVREVADWYLQKFPQPESFGNLGYWAASYGGIFMCEYLLATGDDRVRPWIAAALTWVEEGFHTSKWGMPALGHGPNGLPYDDKALMAPASHLIVFEALAKQAGIASTIWETLFPYMKHSWSDPSDKGHGAMGYNASYRDLGEFWSRSGLFALACELRGEKAFMKRPIAKIMRERHPWMRNSHAYGNPGDTWGLVGLAAADREAFAEVMRAWRWSFGGAWEPGFGLRHTTAHMGSPYMGGDGLVNPAVAMLLSVRHRGLFITGAPETDRGWLVLPSRVAPASPILVEVDASGRVHLRPEIAGPRLFYTLDGSEPTASSTLYEAPFALPEGGLVRARVLGDDGSCGETTTQVLGLPKIGWTVLRADGDSDPERARGRAQALIDNDAHRPWQVDEGKGTPSLPYGLVIDMGSPQTFLGLRFSGAHRPHAIRFHASLDLETLGPASDARPDDARYELSPADHQSELRFPGLVTARYLRIDILDLAPQARRRLGELDLVFPELRFDAHQGPSRVHIEPPLPGLEVRSQEPTSTEWHRLDVLPPDDLPKLRFRIFDGDGHPLGPTRVRGHDDTGPRK